MTDAKRVGALWALVLAVFALFSAVYWPVHWRQAFNDPANFMPRAERLHERGQLAAALDTLKKGIAESHPPQAAPYIKMQAWLREFKDNASADALEPNIAFYQALEAGPADRAPRMSAAIDAAAARAKPLQVSGDAARALRAAATGLGAALDLGDVAAGLGPGEQLALLMLAGGKASLSGVVGATETKLPFDLVVQSGGGGQGRRMAHIFVRNRDYGGAERGMHMALIDPVTGEPVQLGLFDIWASDDDADRMAHMLEIAPKGTVGAFAVFDDASANVTEKLEDALRGFGLLPEAIIQRRQRFYGLRYSFAAIGVKGAIPGQAMQAWSPEEYMHRPGHPVACMVLGASLEQDARP